MRRTAIAFAASLGLHAGFLLGGLRLPAALASRGYLVPIMLEDVRELPLRQPPRARKARAKDEASRPRRSGRPDPGTAISVPPRQRDGASAARSAAAEEVASTRRRGDVSAYGPEGSRLVAVLRLDRLRAARDAQAHLAAIDEALRLLPDRQRLLDGTRLDLYRDFDALLVATPNPLDDTATFVAARHRIEEKALRAALDRGARAAGQTIAWRKERGRYVGVRRSTGRPADPSRRDERLFVLPAPGLLVIASPAHAKLLLDGAAAVNGGNPARAPAAAGQRVEGDWSRLVARIGAEDEAVPENAAFVLTATNMMLAGEGAAAPGTSPGSAVPGSSGGDGPGSSEGATGPGQGTAAPGTRGTLATSGVAGAAAPGASGKTDAALPPAPGATPREVSLIVGTIAAPSVEIRAEFEKESEARSWEASWPGWKRELLANPLVLLARVDPLISRTEMSREDRTLVLRTAATSEELLRVLRMIGSLAAMSAEGRDPQPAGQR